MIEVSGFARETVAVLGLARSGLAAAHALIRGGARVLAWDDSAEARLRAAAQGVSPCDLTDPTVIEWSRVACLVLSPGIPHTFPTPHPVAAAARAAGVPILGDVELLARTRREASYIGITGTNGKSTTTALVGHVLAKAGREVEVGGNLGPPVLAMRPLGAAGTYVLEMSSYQLELIERVVFDVAVLLNISPDHLGRHGGLAGYVAAKRRIFDRQGAGASAVIGVDDEHGHALWEDLRSGPARVIPVAVGRAVPGGVYAIDGLLFDATSGGEEPVMELGKARALPGAHNWQNAAAAWAVARASGLEKEAVVEGIRTYPGLAHRQETIAVVEGVTYVNDSKATNADAAARALACYDAIYWIIGGLPKEGGLRGTEPLLGRVRRAFAIGQAADDFARFLESECDRSPPCERCGDLGTAVRRAREVALAEGRPGAVVLLSPACASFDQFANFEARGDAFRAEVETIAREATA